MTKLIYLVFLNIFGESPTIQPHQEVPGEAIAFYHKAEKNI